MKNFDRVIILHGCPPNQQSVTPQTNRWMNWLADKLSVLGYDAIAPDLPLSWKPQYVDWKREFEKHPVTHNTLLIGHSCGAAFLVRWLLDVKKKVKKLILVAPAKISESESDSRKDLYSFQLVTDVSDIADEIVIFTSNDLPHHLKSLEIYKKALNPRIIKLENKIHFLYSQMKTNEFPELLEEVLHT